MAIVSDILRLRPGGEAVMPGTQVDIVRERDSAVLDTVTTDSDGVFRWETPGWPGPIRYEAELSNGVRRVHSTRGVFPMGVFDTSALAGLFRMWSNGVVEAGGGLNVTASGDDMWVRVASGIGLADGVVYSYSESQYVTITEGGDQPRIDSLIITFWKSGAEAGRSELVTLTGSPADNPSAPSLPSQSGRVSLRLADIRVEAEAEVIASDKVTDRRDLSAPQGDNAIPDGEITTPKLANGSVTESKIANLSVTFNKLASDAVGTSRIQDSAVTQAKIANSAVGPTQIASNAVTADAIADGAVNRSLMLGDNVLFPRMFTNSAVQASAIANNAVSEDKLSSAVRNKLNASGTPGSGSITTAMLANGAVTNAKLGSSAIATANIANNQVTEAKLSSAVRTKLNASGGGGTFSQLFPLNRTFTSGSTNLREGPNTYSRVIGSSVTGDQIHDTGIRVFNEGMNWAFIWDRYGVWCWCLTSAFN